MPVRTLSSAFELLIVTTWSMLIRAGGSWFHSPCGIDFESSTSTESELFVKVMRVSLKSAKAGAANMVPTTASAAVKPTSAWRAAMTCSWVKHHRCAPDG